MKRSMINECITVAEAFFRAQNFVLPQFAVWHPEQWAHNSPETRDLRLQRLGWDVTDFNSGNFAEIGLTIFTLRNGNATQAENRKPYAEKIMHVRDQQVTPYHYHRSKVEDIINRGNKNTGRLLLKLFQADADGGFSQNAFTIHCDGIERPAAPGEEVILGSGESITLPPNLYHTFHAIDGDALVGEVSSLNDDESDNFFYEPVGRYPDVEEDEPPYRLLCNEYARAATLNR